MTKRRALISRLYERRHLERAWRQLNRSNPGSAGLSGETIEQFSANLREEIREIQQHLRAGTYEFSRVRGVLASKRGQEDKFRPIRIQEVRDRLVARALVSLISSPMEQIHGLDNEISYAYQKHRGVRDAWMRVLSLYQRHNPWALEADIKSFFDAVDTDHLLETMVYPHLQDTSLNDLIRDAITQSTGNLDELPIAHRDLFADSGIPQGNSLSPLLANVYLAPLDKLMSGEGWNAVRYADDFIVLCNSEPEARAAYERCSDFLRDSLKLELHPVGAKTRIRAISQGVQFLGLQFDGQSIRPLKDRRTDFQRTLQLLASPRGVGRAHDVLTMLKRCRSIVQGWISSFSHADLAPYLLDLDSLINETLGRGLVDLRWRGRSRGALTTAERRHSGVRFSAEYLVSSRAAMPENHRHAFSKYWTVPQVPKAGSH